jgi:DNA-binding protein Fis
VEVSVVDAEPLALAELEKRHILSVMEKTPSRTQAAKVLGISIRTLRNKLHEYGVKSKEEEAAAETDEPEAQ